MDTIKIIQYEGGSVSKKKSRSKIAKRIVAENTIRKIAECEGISTESVRKQIQTAMINGLCSTDSKVKAFWAAVPREKEIPTPQELILCFRDDKTQFNQRQHRTVAEADKA